MDSDNGSHLWHFVLYTAASVPASVRAEKMLRKLCRRYLNDEFTITVIDILNTEDPIPHDILAIPTIVRVSPAPERRVVGDLSEVEKAVSWLGLDEVTVDG